MKLIALAAALGAALMLPASAAPKKGPRTNAVSVKRWPAPLRGVGGHAKGACAPLRELHLQSWMRSDPAVSCAGPRTADSAESMRG